MGCVLQFPEHGSKNTAADMQSGPPEPLAPNSFYCMDCEGDGFLLYPSGQVQCAECGAKINNLSVSMR